MKMEKITIDEAINKWFEMKYQTYDKLEHEDSIYLYYVGEEYADIRIDNKYKKLSYNWRLHTECSEIISLNFIQFKIFMIRWFEDTFDLKGFTPEHEYTVSASPLKIPI